MRSFVMLFQKILSPIVLNIPPDRMDVVRVVLGIVVFDEKTGTVQPVVMGLPRFFHSCPGEMDMFFPFLSI